MTKRSTRYLLLPLLALCLTFAVSARAGTSASLQITFGTAPHWSSMGNGVRRINDGDGPGYDMFLYGGSYYAFNNDQWYRCRTMRGHYEPIEQRYVPGAFSKVGRNHWRHYPSAWNGNGNGNNGRGNGKGNDRGNDRGNDHGNDRGNGKDNGQGHK